MTLDALRYTYTSGHDHTTFSSGSAVNTSSDFERGQATVRSYRVSRQTFNIFMLLHVHTQLFYLLSVLTSSKYTYISYISFDNSSLFHFILCRVRKEACLLIIT